MLTLPLVQLPCPRSASIFFSSSKFCALSASSFRFVSLSLLNICLSILQIAQPVLMVPPPMAEDIIVSPDANLLYWAAKTKKTAERICAKRTWAHILKFGLTLNSWPNGSGCRCCVLSSEGLWRFNKQCTGREGTCTTPLTYWDMNLLTGIWEGAYWTIDRSNGLKT